MAPADRALAAKLAAESVGTFALVFVGVLVLTAGRGSGLVGAALAHGLAIAVMASATMAISGAHLNPAVTAAVWAARRIPGPEALSYVLAQLAGASLAAVAAAVLAPGGDATPGVPALAPGVSPSIGMLAEAVATFFLVFVVFGTAIDSRSGGRVGGLAIGLAVGAGVFAVGPLSGAAMNPARWFGPALATGLWSDAPVWLAGPLVGAIAASALWSGLLLPRAAPRTPIEP